MMNYQLALTAALIAVASSRLDEWGPDRSQSEERPGPRYELEPEDRDPRPWDEERPDPERRGRKFESEEFKHWRPEDSEHEFRGERFPEPEFRPRQPWRSSEERSSSEEHLSGEESSGEFEHRPHHRRHHHRRWRPRRHHHHHRPHFPFRRHHRRHGCKPHFRHHCPKFGEWQESACLWPGQETKIPESCHANFSAFLPKAVAQYYENKAQELKSVVETLFKKRGITKACGFCSKKMACRKRKMWKKHGCKPIEFAFVKDECQDDNNACELTLVDGGCPPPMPQKRAVKHNRLVAKHRHFRHKGPMEFHERRFGFEQSDFEWNNEPEESHSEESEEGTSSEMESTINVDAITVTPATDATDVNATLQSRVARSAENEWQSRSREFSMEGRHHPGPKHHGRHHDKRHSPFIPLWHCVKSKQGDKCLCCCGGYFPDADTGKCVAVEGGNRFPPVPMVI